MVGLVAAVSLTAAACGGGSKHGLDREPGKTTPTGVVTPINPSGASGSGRSSGPLRLTSPAFPDGGAMPNQYTCAGANQSVPLLWTGVPGGTAALAVRMQDVDTPQQFIHWILYGIPPSVGGVPAGQAPVGAAVAKNSFGQSAYTGPCPPAGQRHRYVFTLLALARDATPPAGAKAADTWSALEASSVLGRAQLTGTFQRPATPGPTNNR